ncbi:MAG TPA: TPM domain-containing protein [Phycisphaerae bacterium]|nr:TPM domain-containing protein [Phycisphaerae bacterium]
MRVRPILLLLTLLLTVVSASPARGAPSDLPRKPSRYITDNAGVISPPDLEMINRQLDEFERTTSNQFLVAIYPQLPEGEELADYCTRTFESWHPGKKATSNGVVLFVFVNSHKMQITPGYGLEGALPDATCKDIIDTKIAPHFKTGDYTGGVRAGVNAIIAATKGEYHGTGATVRDIVERHIQDALFWTLAILILGTSLIRSALRRHFGTVYGSRQPTGLFNHLLYAWAMRANSSNSSSDSGWFSSGGFLGGGGGGGFSSGGFSSGGGSTGGGGAGGSW